GGPFGVCELVEVVPLATGRKIGRYLIDRRRIFDEVAAPAVELDQLALLSYGRCRHHSDKRQIEQPGEVGLTDRGGPRRRLNERGALIDPVVAEAIEHQGTRQPMLQAPGRMDRLVLQIEIDAPPWRQRERVQVS